jgi:hypothetical protein
MRILVIGAAGMLGGTLVERLVRDGRLWSERISQLTLVDRLAAEPSGDPGVVERAVADLAEPGMAGAIVTGRPDAIFPPRRGGLRRGGGRSREGLPREPRCHANAARAIRGCDQGYRPRLVYSSSIAGRGVKAVELNCTMRNSSE